MLNPRLTKGWLPPPCGFFLVAPKPKTSNLGHVDDLSDIFRGHFDERRGITLPGARVSRRRPVARWWISPEKIQNRHLKTLLIVWSWNFQCMLSRKFGEIPIFGTCLVEYLILANFLLKICYFVVIRPTLWRHCDVMRWMFVLILVRMEIGEPYWRLIRRTLGFPFSNSQVVLNTPLVNRVTKKKKKKKKNNVRRGLK